MRALEQGEKMPQSIVLQLQDIASDGKYEISDLLRKALLVSTKLNLHEHREWILSELNGYKDSSLLPEYRIIRGDLRVQNLYHGLIPFILPHTDLMETVTKIRLSESVSSLEQLANSEKKGSICFFLGPELEAALMRMQGSYPLRPLVVVGENVLLAIIQSVRTRILEWALSLEAAGILGESLSFSEKERNVAMTNKTIQIQNFQGVLGDVSGGSITQSNTITITSGNFDSLAQYLKEQGVQSKEIAELEIAIAGDPEPQQPGMFGGKVSAWIGKMVGLAASGGWEISVSTASTLIAAALTKYYGF